MIRGAAAACIALVSACDTVLGLERGVDAVVTMPCSMPPDLDAFRAIRHDGFPDVVHPDLHPSVRDGVAVYHADGALYEVGVDQGTRVMLEELDVPDAIVADPSLSADGTSIVFVQRRSDWTLWWSTRAEATARPWDAPRALVLDLPLPSTGRYPSEMALYDGRFRIVVAAGNRLREFASDDRERWLELETLLFSQGFVDDSEPYLSPDGCWLLFASTRDREELGTGYDLYVAHRIEGGTFSAPERLALSSDDDDYAPAFDPIRGELWFLQGTSSPELWRATP